MMGLRLTRENSRVATGYASHCHRGKDNGHIGYQHKQSCYSPCWAQEHICTCSRRPHLCLKDPSTVAWGMTKYDNMSFKVLQICRQSSDRNDTTRNRMPAQDACGFSNGHVGVCLHLGIIPNILLEWQQGACEKWCLPTMGGAAITYNTMTTSSAMVIHSVIFSIIRCEMLRYSGVSYRCRHIPQFQESLNLSPASVKASWIWNCN